MSGRFASITSTALPKKWSCRHEAGESRVVNRLLHARKTTNEDPGRVVAAYFLPAQSGVRAWLFQSAQGVGQA